MHIFTTVTLTVLLSLSQVIYGHPSFLDTRTQVKNYDIPIDQLFLKDSKAIRSGTSSSKSILLPASKENDHLLKPISPTYHTDGADFHCFNDPCCPDDNNPFKDNYQMNRVEWREHPGITRSISEAVCPPGSVTNSITLSYQYSVNVNLGPDLKIGPSIFDKFGFRIGFAYNWGKSTTTAYTANCSDGDNFPCIAIFTPSIGVIKGVGWIERIGKDGRSICSKSQESHIEYHVPVLNTDCKGSRNTCGVRGSYDHCFIPGKAGADLCPRSGLKGKVLKHRVCPAGLF